MEKSVTRSKTRTTNMPAEDLKLQHQYTLVQAKKLLLGLITVVNQKINKQRH